MKIDRTIIKEYVEQGYISETKHPYYPIYIYNYTAKTQYERFWNEYTLMCRGLILDEAGHLVARPFKKFFNWEEDPNVKLKNPINIYEKLDGSAIIMYSWAGKWNIATRGSFTSDQSIIAKKLWDNKYSKFEHILDFKYTYMFELIGPSNVIVNRYLEDELILLSKIETKSGLEILPHMDMGYEFLKKSKHYGSYSLTEDVILKYKKYVPNFEGYVFVDQDNFRFKLKLDEYVRLHKLITGSNEKTIWEFLKNGESINILLDRVPDEFYEWVKETSKNLENEYKSIEEDCKIIHKTSLDKAKGNRKKYAELVLNNKKYSTICFNMLDGKEYSENIWKLIKPKINKTE